MKFTDWLAPLIGIANFGGRVTRPQARQRLHRESPTRTSIEMLEDRTLLTVPGIYDLSGLEMGNGGDGSRGFVVDGLAAGDRLGYAVASAGDLNGDGYEDIVLAAPFKDIDALTDAGGVYVVFGDSEAFDAELDLSTLDGTNGFRIDGIAAGDLTGLSVGSAGDINNDGLSDLLIGIPTNAASPEESIGHAILILGSTSFGATIDASTLDGTDGFTIASPASQDFMGISVASAGDINGDGIFDIAIGAPDSDLGSVTNGGAAFVVFGRESQTTAFPASIDLSTLDGTDGFRIQNTVENGRIGSSVAGLGDVNGDGYDDLFIGSLNLSHHYVLFGHGGAFSPSVTLSTIGAGTGFAITGYPGSGRDSDRVSGVGDFNGDGYNDFLLKTVSTTEIHVYLMLGHGGAWPLVLDVTELDGSNGTAFTGLPFDMVTSGAVGGAGDFNGDGFDDLIIGRPSVGETFLVFGTATALSATIDLSMMDLPAGVTFTDSTGSNVDRLGFSAATAGDLNGDGFADIVIGANEHDGGDNGWGRAYVFFGEDTNSEVTHLGGAMGDTLTGDSDANVMVGGDGDDTILGNGGADVLNGGAGDDVLAISDLTFQRVVGGTGLDTLRLDGAGMDLDLTGISGQSIQGIERIDLAGSGANTLTVSLLSVLNLSDSTNTLIVHADGDDALHLDSDWVFAGEETIDSQQYWVYRQGNAEILIDTPVTNLTGRVWFDINGNGIQDTDDVDIPAVTVEYQVGQTVGENVVYTTVDSTTSDADGQYRIVAFGGGTTYRLLVSNLPQPSGTVLGLTRSDQGADDSLDSDFAAMTGVTGDFSLAAHPLGLEFDAGLVVLDAPSLILPPTSTIDTTPVFTWSEVQGAARYDLWVNDLTTGQIEVIRNQSLTETFFQPTIPLINGHDYIWTVRAYNTDGAAGEWATHNIVTINQGLVPQILTPTPKTIDTSPELSWTEVRGADHYDVWVNDLTTGTSGVVRNQNVNGTSHTPQLLDGHDYVWTVRGVSDNGEVGGWATHQYFRINTSVKSTLLLPPARTMDFTPTFAWTALPGAARYDIWVNDLTSGQNAIIRDPNLTDTTYTSTVRLTDGHDYIWTVRGINDQGIGSSWATHAVFTISTSLKPQLISPITASTTDATPTFSWTAVNGADHYDLWVNDLTSGQSGIIRETNVSGTSYTPTTPLNSFHRYTWTVRAVNEHDVNSAWGTHQIFSYAALAAPTIQSPIGTVTTTTPTFSWAAVAGADHYDVWVNNLTTGQFAVIRNTNVPTTSAAPGTPLTNFHQYTWTVRAISADGVYSDWAPHQVFNIAVTQVDDFESVSDLVAPANAELESADDDADDIHDAVDELAIPLSTGDPLLANDDSQDAQDGIVAVMSRWAETEWWLDEAVPA